MKRVPVYWGRAKRILSKRDPVLRKIIKKIKIVKGPILLKINISKTAKVGKRIEIEPTKIKSRFQESLIY